MLKELLFINIFCIGKGCKLLKINSSFRIRGKNQKIFLHPLANLKFLSDNSVKITKNLKSR